jgi:hypothetical protein
LPDHKVLPDFRVTTVFKVNKESRGYPVQLDLKVLQEMTVFKEFRDLRDLKGMMVSKDYKEFKV